MRLDLPDFALVAVFGPDAGETARFVTRHFDPRAVVATYPAGVTATPFGTAPEPVPGVSARLAVRALAVVHASSLSSEGRRALVSRAKHYHATPVALVFAAPASGKRGGGATQPPGARKLQSEGFRHIHVLDTPDALRDPDIRLTPLAVDLRGANGPFDIIGDLHGCFEETCTLLGRLGYRLEETPSADGLIRGHHPGGRQAIFVGDLTDRGPRSLDSLRLVMGLSAAGAARCVIGNHDHKLRRALEGRGARIGRALAATLAELETAPAELRDRIAVFLGDLPSHLWLDGGVLAVAHAGLLEDMIGRDTAEVRDVAMFGETTGKLNEFGLPERVDWGRAHRGATTIVYGHTPRRDVQWVNRTLCIDTGCAFGGTLTALRWPEREIVSVPALRTYAAPKKPLDAGHC